MAPASPKHKEVRVYIERVYLTDLRALLFWATIGVSKAKGGTYQTRIGNIIEHYATELNFKLPCKPEFKGGKEK